MINEDNEDPSVQLSNRVVRENQTTLRNMIISRKIDPECMIFAEGNIKQNEIKRTLAKAENEINPKEKL